MVISHNTATEVPNTAAGTDPTAEDKVAVWGAWVSQYLVVSPVVCCWVQHSTVISEAETLVEAISAAVFKSSRYLPF
jgi:hypothetical protein